MKIQGIYKIVNKINNKIYIGQSIDIIRRFYSHKNNAIVRNIKHPLYNSFKKYGIDNFEFIIIEIVDDTFLLDQREQHWLDHYQSYLQEKGYNICKEATSTKGYKHSKYWLSSRKGYKHTKATCIKLSNSHKGKKLSEESIRKRTESRKNYKHTEETRKNIANSLKGKKKPPRTEEHRKNISIANKGKKRSEETINKWRESRRGYKPTEETKLKLKEKSNLQWADAELRKKQTEKQISLWKDPIYREKILESRRNSVKYQNRFNKKEAV